MSDAAKKGALGGAALLGLVGIRSADNCAGAAARGARVAGDDVVRMGARTGDDALEAAARGGRIEWGPAPGRPGLRGSAATPEVASSDELVKTLAEGGLDIGLEVVQLDLDVREGASPAPTGVACPVPHDLTLEPEHWSKFLDGFGIACAPAVFIGRAKGDALEVDGVQTPVETLAQQCAEAGGVCFFIGCEGQGRCFSDASKAAYGVRLRRELVPYMYELAQQELTEAKPAWVAFSPTPGELSLLLSR